MQKILKIGVYILLSFYLVAIGVTGYILHIYGNLAIWQALTFCGIIILLSFIFLYPLYHASKKKDSDEDLQRESSVMEDVMDVRRGRYSNTKTNLGKWYLGAFIVSVLFPLIGWIVGKLIDSAEAEQNMLLILGYFVIISFVVGIVITNKRKVKDKNTKI